MIGAVCLLGFGRVQVLVDAEDLCKLAAGRWRLHTARVTRGARYVYVARREGPTLVLLHRRITGAQAGEVVDHINGNRLDNRIANLRVCSHAENMQNRKMNVDNTSGFKGVSWSRSNRGWRAVCGRRYIGTYATPEEASAAYEAAAEERFAHRSAGTNSPTLTISPPRCNASSDSFARSRRNAPT